MRKADYLVKPALQRPCCWPHHLQAWYHIMSDVKGGHHPQVVPLEALQIFSHAELELLISGLPDIDIADLRRHTYYGSGLVASDRLVQWFWQIVEGMSKQDVALLVQFVTGAPRPCCVPLHAWLQPRLQNCRGLRVPRESNQYVSAGSSKVPLEGFRALTGISGPQQFSIHKSNGSSDRLPTAHTCFNQLDLYPYESQQQLHDRLLLAIHECATGFGFA
jgi:E3 ubiquitin-protein ligase HUWE1